MTHNRSFRYHAYMTTKGLGLGLGLGSDKVEVLLIMVILHEFVVATNTVFHTN
jgi:hypothetical protein